MIEKNYLTRHDTGSCVISPGGDEMILANVFEQFVKQSPVSVMVRATLENVLSQERVNELFARTAKRQRPSELMFATVADVMGTVVCRVRPSIHAAYQAQVESFHVSLEALYAKLRKTEPRVSRALVQETAERMGAIIRQTGGALPDLLPGYHVLIVDGNHLPATERRIARAKCRALARAFAGVARSGADVGGGRASLPGRSRFGADPAAGLVGDAPSEGLAHCRP
jgi:hypothetical protein